jgi:hypothetical protein
MLQWAYPHHGRLLTPHHYNSGAGLRWAAGLGADSVDGTGWAVWRNANLPGSLAAAQAATRQGRLL